MWQTGDNGDKAHCWSTSKEGHQVRVQQPVSGHSAAVPSPVFAIVSPESGNHLMVGLAAVTALNLFLRRHCLLGLAFLPGAFSLVLAVESSKAPSFWGTWADLGAWWGVQGLRGTPSPARPSSLRLAAVHSLSLELSDDTDQLCNPETLFMVTNMASSLMYARNQLVIPPVTSYVWLSYSISLWKIIIQDQKLKKIHSVPHCSPHTASGRERLSTEQDKPLLEASKVQLECIFLISLGKIINQHHKFSCAWLSQHRAVSTGTW